MSKGAEWVVPVLGAVAICGALLYALGNLADTPNRLSAALVPTAPKPQALPAASTASPPSREPQVATAPAANPNAPALPAIEPQNIVRTATRTYVLPPPRSTAEEASDIYRQLQRNCYEAAANNRQGDYPALQQLACQRYANFASSHGFDPGTLPAYGQAVQSPRPQPAAVVASAGNSGECAALINEKDQINARMRAGYQEPWGQQMRDRLHDIGIRLWELHCPRQ